MVDDNSHKHKDAPKRIKRRNDNKFNIDKFHHAIVYNKSARLWKHLQNSIEMRHTPSLSTNKAVYFMNTFQSTEQNQINSNNKSFLDKKNYIKVNTLDHLSKNVFAQKCS